TVKEAARATALFLFRLGPWPGEPFPPPLPRRLPPGRPPAPWFLPPAARSTPLVARPRLLVPDAPPRAPPAPPLASSLPPQPWPLLPDCVPALPPGAVSLQLPHRREPWPRFLPQLSVLLRFESGHPLPPFA